MKKMQCLIAVLATLLKMFYGPLMVVALMTFLMSVLSNGRALLAAPPPIATVRAVFDAYGFWLALQLILFVDVFRALPPLVAILLIYFGFPSIGISLPSFVVLWLVLSFVLAAFAEEIFWAGITSTPKGQWEAARSTGLTFSKTLTYVVLPQAIRLGVPPLTNRTIAITKNTALGTVIGVGEILNQATTAQSFTGNATPLMMGAIAYIVLFIPVVAAGRWIETRFAWRRA